MLGGCSHFITSDSVLLRSSDEPEEPEVLRGGGSVPQLSGWTGEEDNAANNPSSGPTTTVCEVGDDSQCVSSAAHPDETNSPTNLHIEVVTLSAAHFLIAPAVPCGNVLQ